MPIRVSEQQKATAFGAMMPLEGIDPGFVANWKAAWNESQDFQSSNANHANRFEVVQGFVDQFRQASGQPLPNWLLDEPVGGPQLASRFEQQRRQAVIDQARAQFDGWKKQNPDTDLVFPDEAMIQQKADEKARGSIAAADKARRLSKGWGSSVGALGGNIAGAAADPVNIVAMLYGAGPSAGILRTALTEAGINAAAETVVQVTTADTKRRIDPTYSTRDALQQIAFAGAGGAVIGGGLKGLANIWQRAATGEWPRHIRDAANVVDREASIPANRQMPSAPGQAAHRAAIDKASEDILAGRPVELPPDLFLRGDARPGRVFDADGRSVGVNYEVVEGSDLITSNTDDLTVNPAFPAELQPRDRTRALGQTQVQAIASNLQPERLGPSPQADSGAPIVGPDGVVESGNGRVLALREAYRQDGASAANYKNFLRAQGFDPDAFSRPVLIARRVTDLTPEDRIAFAAAANRATALRLGASEQALADARLIDESVLSQLQGADVDTLGNTGFVRAFMAKLPRAEQGEMLDRAGVLSQTGERRLMAALMGRAYADPVLLGRALEDADSNVKALAGALSDAAPAWVRMRDAVSAGAIPRGMDVTPDLLEAVRIVMRARDTGRPASELFNQAEMFGGPSELAKVIGRAMFSDADMRRAVSRTRLADFLHGFATEAGKNEAAPRLFGDALGADDILRSSLARVGREDLQPLIADRLTPEAVDKLAKGADTMDAVIQEAQRLRAAVPDIVIDTPDGQRSLAEIMDEADDELAASADIEACTIGRTEGATP